VGYNQGMTDGDRVELLTSSFWDLDPALGVPVRTSIGMPRGRLSYDLTEAIRDLMPYGKVAGGDLRRCANKAIFTEAYRRIHLERVGVERLRMQFAEISDRHDGRPLIILCFERRAAIARGETFCHRRVFADWWQEQTGEVVEEIGGLDPPAPPPPDTQTNLGV
jgi:hypothetical protein